MERAFRLVIVFAGALGFVSCTTETDDLGRVFNAEDECPEAMLGTPCGAPDPCAPQVWTCSEAGELACTGVEPAPDGTPCGDACALAACSAGVCVSTGTTSCDDGDACTTSRCDPTLGCVSEVRLTATCCQIRAEPLGGAETFARGSIEDIVVQDGIAYVARARLGVGIYDVRDPTAVRPLAEPDTAGYAIELYKHGDLLLVGDRSTWPYETAGVRIFDVADPSRPSLVGSYERPDLLVVGLHAAGDTAYVAGYADELQAVDISNPAQPRLRSAIPIGDALAFVGAGERGYISDADGRGSLVAVDLANPDALNVLWMTPLFPNPHGLTIRGSLLFASEYNRLAVFDVGRDGPASLGVQAGEFGRALVATSERLFVAGSRGLQVRGPLPQATQQAWANVPENTRTIDVEASFAYVGANQPAPTRWNPGSYAPLMTNSGLWIFEVDNPDAPRNVARVFEPGAARQVRVRDGRAYVADLMGGLRVFDVERPEAPVEVARVPLSAATQLELTEEYIVAVTEPASGAVVHLLSRPSDGAPVELDRLQIGGEEVNLRVDGSQVYVTKQVDLASPGTLHILEMVGDALIERSQLSVGPFWGDVAVYGGFVYVAGRQLIVIDATDLSAPFIISQDEDLWAGVHFAIGDGVLFGAGSGIPNAVVAWSLADPAGPVRTAFLEFQGPVFDMAVEDGFLLAAGGALGLRVFDVADPTALRLFAELPTRDQAWGVDFVGRDMFVADGFGSLRTYALRCGE